MLLHLHFFLFLSSIELIKCEKIPLEPIRVFPEVVGASPSTQKPIETTKNPFDKPLTPSINRTSSDISGKNDHVGKQEESPTLTIPKLGKLPRPYKIRIIKRNITKEGRETMKKPEGFKKHDKLALESKNIYVTVPPVKLGHIGTKKDPKKFDSIIKNVIKSVSFFVPPNEEEMTLQKKLEALRTSRRSFDQQDEFESLKQKVNEKHIHVPQIGEDWSPKYAPLEEDDFRREKVSSSLLKDYEKLFMEKIGEITETLAKQDLSNLFHETPVIFGLFQAAIRNPVPKTGKGRPPKYIDNANERKLSIDSQLTANNLELDTKSPVHPSSFKSAPKKNIYNEFEDPTKNTWKGMSSDAPKLTDDGDSWIGYSSPKYAFRHRIFNGENMYRRKFEEKPLEERPYTVFDGAKMFQRTGYMMDQPPQETTPKRRNLENHRMEEPKTIKNPQDYMDMYPYKMEKPQGDPIIWGTHSKRRVPPESPRVFKGKPKFRVDIGPRYERFGSEELGVGLVKLNWREKNDLGAQKRGLDQEKNGVEVSKIELDELPVIVNDTRSDQKFVEDVITGSPFGNFYEEPKTMDLDRERHLLQSDSRMGLYLARRVFDPSGRSEIKIIQAFPTLNIPEIIGLRPPRQGRFRRVGNRKRSFLPTAPYLPERAYLLEPPRAFQIVDSGAQSEVGILSNDLPQLTQNFLTAPKAEETSTKVLPSLTPAAPKPIHLEPVLELLKTDRAKIKPVTELDSEITKLGHLYNFDDSGYINDQIYENIPYGPPMPPKVITSFDPQKINSNFQKTFGIETITFGARNASGFKLRGPSQDDKALRIRNHRFNVPIRDIPIEPYFYRKQIRDVNNEEVVHDINLEPLRRLFPGQTSTQLQPPVFGGPPVTPRSPFNIGVNFAGYSPPSLVRKNGPDQFGRNDFFLRSETRNPETPRLYTEAITRKFGNDNQQKIQTQKLDIYYFQ